MYMLNNLNPINLIKNQLGQQYSTDQAIESSIDSFNIFQRLQKIGPEKSSPADNWL